MKNFVQRAYIQSRLALNENPIRIHDHLVKVHGMNALSYMIVTRWVQRFKAGQESLKDDHRSERTVTESIQRIEALIADNRRLSTYDLEELTSLSRMTILRILHDHLETRKVAARWIPHFLTSENKKIRL